MNTNYENIHNHPGFSKKINEFSVKGHSDFVPTFNYKIYEMDISTVYDFRFLKQYCLAMEQELIHKYPPTDETQSNPLSSRFSSYSLFNFEELKPLAMIVREHYNSFMDALGKDKDHDIYCQSWINVLRSGEQVGRHNKWTSDYTYLSAQLCVETKGNTNYYNPFSGEKWSSPNNFGKLTIFPSWIEHDADVITGKDPQITIGMDFYTEQGFKENIVEDKKWRWVKI